MGGGGQRQRGSVRRKDGVIESLGKQCCSVNGKGVCVCVCVCMWCGGVSTCLCPTLIPLLLFILSSVLQEEGTQPLNLSARPKDLGKSPNSPTGNLFSSSKGSPNSMMGKGGLPSPLGGGLGRGSSLGKNNRFPTRLLQLFVTGHSAVCCWLIRGFNGLFCMVLQISSPVWIQLRCSGTRMLWWRPFKRPGRWESRSRGSITSRGWKPSSLPSPLWASTTAESTRLGLHSNCLPGFQVTHYAYVIYEMLWFIMLIWNWKEIWHRSIHYKILSKDIPLTTQAAGEIKFFSYQTRK